MFRGKRRTTCRPKGAKSGGMDSVSINIWPLQGQRQASTHSALSAGNKGDRSAAHVATSDAVSPDTNTASSNKPSET